LIISWGSKEQYPVLARVKSEAYSLLNNGLTPEEIPKAVEYILGLQAGYYEQNSITKIATWAICCSIVILILSILIIIFRPKTCIAIGQGINSLRRQRKWIKFINVFLPSFIILGILASIIGNWLFLALGVKP